MAKHQISILEWLNEHVTLKTGLAAKNIEIVQSLFTNPHVNNFCGTQNTNFEESWHTVECFFEMHRKISVPKRKK